MSSDFHVSESTAAEFSAAQCLIHQWGGQFIVRCMAGWLATWDATPRVDVVKQQAKRTRQSPTFFCTIHFAINVVGKVEKKFHFTVGISPLKSCERLTALHTHTHTHVAVKLPLYKKTKKQNKRVNFYLPVRHSPKWSCQRISNIRMEFFPQSRDWTPSFLPSKKDKSNLRDGYPAWFTAEIAPTG